MTWLPLHIRLLTHCGLVMPYSIHQLIWVLWHYISWSTLVQMIVCCLFRTKPLTAPMLTYCQLISIKRFSIHMCVSHPYPNPAHSKEQWCHGFVDSLSTKHKDIYGLTLSQVNPRLQRGIHNFNITDDMILTCIELIRTCICEMSFINISKYQNYRYDNWTTRNKL